MLDRKLGVGGEVGRIVTEEVVVRPPEVFVRLLAHEEAVRLKRLSTRAKHQSTRIRAAILLASNVGMSVPEIARMWLTDDSHVRKVIHEFNERGFDSLDPDYRGGRPRRLPSRPPRGPAHALVAGPARGLARRAGHRRDQPGPLGAAAGRRRAVVSA